MVANRERILLAESDEQRAQVLARGFRELGVDAHLAFDLPEALAAAKALQPDAVVVDSLLAGGGMDFVEQLRRHPGTAHIPVLVVLAAEEGDGRRFLAAGAQACLSYPCSAAEVQRTLAHHAPQSLDFTVAPAAVLGQPERVQALYETALLDSPPEESFDRLTRLAARLVGVPTAMVSLVDRDRQFFKSQTGLAQPWAGARQTRLSHSFCQWVVSGKEALVVADANLHPVLRNNLAIKDLGVIAYAGVPLHGRGGHAIGSFCAIDTQPRAWDREALDTLGDLCRIGEAYALLARARDGADASGGLTNMETSIHVAGKAIVGAARVLRRRGGRIGDSERSDLLAIIEEQGAHLCEIVPASADAAAR